MYDDDRDPDAYGDYSPASGRSVSCSNCGEEMSVSGLGISDWDNIECSNCYTDRTGELAW